MDSSNLPKMSFWGIGPLLTLDTLLCAALTGAATHAWPERFAFHGIPYPALLMVGLLLLAVGIPFQIIAGRALMKAYNQDRLITSGVYALCRNPLYANIILTLLPALALLCDSWLMLTTSVFAYVLVRVRIGREEKYLVERFGQEYIEYCRRTNMIFPTIFSPHNK